MGSTFITLEDKTIQTVMGREEPVPIYMQFVPGVVLHVVTSSESVAIGSNEINSIIAKPYYTEKVTNRTSEMLNENNSYKPLFRGIVDVPTKGDPVLLCTFGGIKYYLGPLNSENSPNFNVDTSFNPEFDFTSDMNNRESLGLNQNESIMENIDVQKQESINFNKEDVNRIEKKYNTILDHPADPITGEQELEDGFPKDRTEGEIHGDMIFEGRHGNSIRIGSRHVNPYIVISNGREIGNTYESFGDAGFLAMTSWGTLKQHFGSSINDDNDVSISSDPFSATFNLSSDRQFDTDNLRGRTIFDLIQSMNEEADVTEIIYKYNQPQILLSSERITIDSKGEDIYLSSTKNINIGAGKNLLISTNEDTIIESRNIYLGKEAYTKVKAEDSENPAEPLVLGQQLVELFGDLIDTLMETQCLTPAGSPVPVMDSTMAPIKGDGVGRKGLETIKGEINKILSIYHYIESNGDPKEIKIEKSEEQ